MNRTRLSSPAIMIHLVLLLLAISYTLPAHARKPQAISTTKITETLYVLSHHQSGNIVVSAGKDGTFLIDNGRADISQLVSHTLNNLSLEAPKFIVNTHWHDDHTGGNHHFAEQGAIIIAHDNARQRMTEDKFIEAFNYQSPPKPQAALPIVSFDKSLSLYLNGDTIQVSHIANAHTDGDSIIAFAHADVIHTGDVFFNGFYPFIDTHHGGSLKGMLAATDEVLSLANEKTVIIPGHGPIADKKDLQKYRDMLDNAYTALKALKLSEKTLAQAIALKPLASFESEWMHGHFSSEQWIEIVYPSLD